MKYDFDKIIPREHTVSVKFDLREAFFGKADVIPMWVADMDFEVPEFVSKAIQDRAKHPIYGYSFLSETYYQSIINWVGQKHGWTIQKDWIAHSPGIVTAVNLLVQALTLPGDPVIVQPPVYFPFFSAVQNNGRKLLYNQLINENGNYRMDFNDLEEKCREGAKMLILCSPHNPVGRVWTKEELQKIGDLAIKYDMLIVSDEIHNDLVFDPYKHIPTASLSEEIASRTVTCIAPSKTFNLAGMATSSVIISDPELRQKFKTQHEKMHLNNNIFGTVASEAAYSQGKEWLAQLMDYLKGNAELLRAYMTEYLPRIRISPLEATYLIWLDFNALDIKNSDLKTKIIEEAGLGFNDGRMFGPGGEGFQRMNIACPRPVLQEALERLRKVFA